MATSRPRRAPRRRTTSDACAAHLLADGRALGELMNWTTFYERTRSHILFARTASERRDRWHLEWRTADEQGGSKG